MDVSNAVPSVAPVPKGGARRLAALARRSATKVWDILTGVDTRQLHPEDLRHYLRTTDG